MRRGLGRTFDDSREQLSEGGGFTAWTAGGSPANGAPPEAPTLMAFHRSLASCIPGLRRLARALTSNSADAADLVQETCLRGLQHWQKIALASVDELQRWLRTVMRNLHYDRSARRRRELSSAIVGDVADESEVGPCQLWRLVDDDAVVNAISALPPRLRSVYVLFANGSSYVTIAERLDIPENTVGTRIRRARRRLQDMLRNNAKGSLAQPILRSRQMIEIRAAC